MPSGNYRDWLGYLVCLPICVWDECECHGSDTDATVSWRGEGRFGTNRCDPWPPASNLQGCRAGPAVDNSSVIEGSAESEI